MNYKYCPHCGERLISLEVEPESFATSATSLSQLYKRIREEGGPIDTSTDMNIVTEDTSTPSWSSDGGDFSGGGASGEF